MKKLSDDLQEALSYAKRLLRFRARSKRELEERLLHRGFSDQTVQNAIENLERSGLIDDEKFAYLFAYDMLTVQGFGPYRIKAKLKQLGISQTVIENVLDKVMKEVDLACLLRKIVKLHKVENEKIQEFLYRRGFSTEYLQTFDIEGGAIK
ncbi:MAG: regulatory protein RecX [Pseudothermotoga sp.]